MLVANQKGVSVVFIIISGIIFSFFILIAVTVTWKIFEQGRPNISTIEKLLKKRKYDEALALSEQLLAKHEHTQSALVYVVKGKVWLARAWQVQEQNKWADYGKDDRDWFKSEEASRAYECFKKAMDIDPENYDARYYLGVLYMEKGWYNEAKEIYTDLLNKEPNHLMARINLGVLYTRLGKFKEAEKELKQAYALKPDYPAISKNLYFLYRYYLKYADSAMVWSNRYLNLHPKADLDLAFVRQDLEDMLNRYPEIAIKEKQQWRDFRQKLR